jgi:hypothetical protein
MRRSVWFYVLCTLGALVALGVLTIMDPWLFQVPWHLVTGWYAFIARVFPQITWRWGAIVQTVFVGAGLGVGTHYLLRWLWRQRHARQDGSPDWPVRWSVSLVSLLVLLFLATMASVGIGHHVGWLSSSRDPLIESSWRRMGLGLGEQSNSAALCRSALELASKGIADSDVARMLLESKDSREDMETKHLLPIRKPAGTAVFVVFSRDPVVREAEGLTRCEAGSPPKRQDFPISVLPRLLAGKDVPASEERKSSSSEY